MKTIRNISYDETMDVLRVSIVDDSKCEVHPYNNIYDIIYEKGRNSKPSDYTIDKIVGFELCDMKHKMKYVDHSKNENILAQIIENSFKNDKVMMNFYERFFKDVFSINNSITKY